MKPKTYWGLGVLVIVMICVCVYLFEKYMGPDPSLLKRPPPGETYTTGHWEGDVWRRTVPPDPEKILVDGVWMTYEDIESKIENKSRIKKRHYRKHALEHYPYSEEALMERLYVAEHDENSNKLVKRIWDKDILVPRYKAMLKWHSDSPYLLYKLVMLLFQDAPEEAIKYGEEALKYTHLYPSDTYYGYWTEPEEIHRRLGLSYQLVGDYDSALAHLKAAVKLMEAHPGRTNLGIVSRTKLDIDDIKDDIKRIKAGRPLWGPAYLDPDYLKR